MKKIYTTLFFLGIFLLTTNIVGLIIPLKNKKIYQQPSGFKNDITLTTKEVFNIINKPIVNKKKYVRNATYAINKGVIHYWTGKHARDYHIILPFYENYLLATFVYLFYDYPHSYEFCNYKKTVERGVGWCSQVSLALADLLNKKNIHTNIIAWPQHTVTEVEVSKNNWWVVDPDYGVIIKHSMKEINDNPSIVLPFYVKKGYSKNIINTFSQPNKKIYPYYGSGFSECNTKKKYIEDLSYIFIWIIPLILILPYSLIKLKKYYAK